MEVFNINSVTWKSILSIVAFAALPGLITYVALRVGKHPGAIRVTLITCAVTVPLFALVIAQMLSAKIRLAEDAFVVGGGVYRVSVLYKDVVAQEIVVGNDSQMPRLRVRTNGIGLPGFAMGWFQSDKRKVFVAYSAGDTAIYVPTRLGYDILASPADAQRLADLLASRAGRGESHSGSN